MGNWFGNLDLAYKYTYVASFSMQEWANRPAQSCVRFTSGVDHLGRIGQSLL